MFRFVFSPGARAIERGVHVLDPFFDTFLSVARGLSTLRYVIGRMRLPWKF